MRTLTRFVQGRACLILLALVSVGAAQGELSDRRLVDAVRQRDAAAIDALFRAGVDVNVPQADDATALAWAAHWDDIGTARRLLEAGAAVDAANDYGVTPLALACLNRSPRMVALLLKAGADPNAAQNKGETVLMTAARTGHPGVVRRLLAAGAAPNTSAGAARQTALMWAAAGGHTAVVGALLDAGADLDARTADGFTALLFAARHGSVDAALLLLGRGADVNELTGDGHSALAIAAASGRAEVALTLLERGAHPDLSDAGYTPLHLAVPKNLLRVARALLEQGADPNARLQSAPAQLFGPSRGAGSDVLSEAGDTAAAAGALTGRRRVGDSNVSATPFFLAAKHANTPMMQLLVAGGADPETTIDDGTTPLMVAAGLTQVQGPRARRGEVSQFTTNWNNPDGLKAVTYLVGLGADPNTVNAAGQTALHGAAYMGADDVVELLVSRGTPLDAQDARGQTPFRIAEAHLNVASQGISQWPETADLLRQLGADTALGIDGRVMLRDIVRRAGEKLSESGR